MLRSSRLIWLGILLIILLPSAFGRLLIDLAGGIIILSLLLPIGIAGLGWIAWRSFQSKLVTCQVCGISSIPNNNQCPLCGAPIIEKKDAMNESSVSASDATIDIKPLEIDLEN